MFDSKSEDRDRAVDAVESVSEARGVLGLELGLHLGLQLEPRSLQCANRVRVRVRVRVRT